MKKAVPTGICGLLCVLFSMIALFASVMTDGWLFAAFAASCLIFSAISVRADSVSVRFACLLPPALLLIPAYGGPAFWILLAVWVVVLLLFTWDKNFQTYSSARSLFPIPSGFSIFAIFMMSLRSLGVSFREFENCNPIIVCGFAVAGLFLLSYTLLCLRAGCPELLRWKAQSAAGALLPALSGGVLVMLIPALGLLGLLLMQPFILLFRLIAVIMGLISRPAEFGSVPDAAEESESLPQGVAIPDVGPDPDLSGIRTRNANSQVPWATIWIILGIVLVVVIVTILLIRYLRRPRDLSEKHPLLVAAPSKMDAPKRVRRSGKRSFNQDNAHKIRELYRSYLRFRMKAGQVILPSQTSLEILNAPSRDAAGDDEIALRSLYLRARYAGPEIVNDADVAAAEALLQVLTSAEASSKK